MSRYAVQQNSISPRTENQMVLPIANRLGVGVMQDFYQWAALAGLAYQVRAGTLSAPLVGDVVITDTAAEMCADAASGTTIVPVYLNIGINLGTGTLHEYAAKAVGAVSTAGTAFVPLPLRTNGSAAVSTARVGAAGAVTVTAELATTTLQLWHAANPVAVGAGNESTTFTWEPRVPAVLVGPNCFYVQIAAASTGPSYFANFTYLEAPTATLL